jgi:hypothetical protein
MKVPPLAPSADPDALPEPSTETELARLPPLLVLRDTTVNEGPVKHVALEIPFP